MDTYLDLLYLFCGFLLGTCFGFWLREWIHERAWNHLVKTGRITQTELHDGHMTYLRYDKEKSPNEKGA